MSLKEVKDSNGTFSTVRTGHFQHTRAVTTSVVTSSVTLEDGWLSDSNKAGMATLSAVVAFIVVGTVIFCFWQRRQRHRYEKLGVSLTSSSSQLNVSLAKYEL
jgi:uncharacterized protein HemX